MENIIGSNFSKESFSQAKANYGQNDIREIADILPLIVWIADAGGKIEYANNTYLQFVGVQGLQNLQSFWTHAIHEKDRVDSYSRWLNSVASGDLFEKEFRIKRFDDSYVWFLCRASPMRDSTGVIQRWIGTATEIEKQKRLLNNIQHSQHQLEVILEGITDGVTVFDRHGKCIYDNSIGADFHDFAVPKEDENSYKSRESAFRLIAETGIILNSSLDYLVTLQKLCELIVPLLADWCLIDIIADPNNPKTIIWHWNPENRAWAESYKEKYRSDWRSSPSTARVISTGKSELSESVSDQALEAVFTNQDQLKELKKLGMSSVMIVPLVVNDSILGAITLAASESKRKFSKFDLTLAEDIGRRAGLAIDKSLLYERERHAREQAENANKSKSSFLANMSHEIRTPLNALIGFNELLRSDSLNHDERAKYHNIIQRNGELLLHLIDDILDLSKVEAGHLALETVQISLMELLSEIKSYKTAKSAAKGLKFIVEVADNVPDEFVTDPHRLKQILINIIGNAIKFTMDGHVKLTVTLDENRQKLVFHVSDTGIGIAPDDREKLFQPFSQSDASVTRKYGGTGLGLILSKRLAQRLGGDLVLIDTHASEGAAFTIEIAANLKANSVAETIVMLPEKSIVGIKILVVDDSVDNQVLMEHILKSRGAIVDTADNGKSGMLKALDTNYDIVLMDVQMPVLDGHSATRMLREKGYTRPIIGLTAHAMQDDRRRCLEAGCTDYLTKPIRTDMLIQTISRHIN